MTAVNHRRKNKKPVNQRHKRGEYNNGYAHPFNKQPEERIKQVKLEYKNRGCETVNVCTTQRVGKTDYLDKSMHGWGRKSDYANVIVGAGIGNDFTNGHRGMAKAVRGAKKFVRTRIRFQENQQLRREISKLG